MKEYLFRGKEIKTKKWVYGGFHEHKPSITAIGKQSETEALIIADGDADWDLPVPIKAHVVEKESVGLYSGFEDKNGAKIFAGDIIKMSRISTSEVCYTGVVVFANGAFLVNYLDGTQGSDDTLCGWTYEPYDNQVEIIGNKSDNPELLKEAGLV
jgi:uncharacterized phage protein (TIGR01671 family)